MVSNPTNRAKYRIIHLHHIVVSKLTTIKIKSQYPLIEKSRQYDSFFQDNMTGKEKIKQYSNGSR